ncbi:DUF885 domain-containing protein [Planctomyces sp. SH-PL62]|uniref:DUF885 domain-containing protein n=1 Tax=Planctomyces sp. SH-PL62 TaxID=1636152 RepID=UPI00078E607F|nr:DUF885 domain-containing protein [Planctomyces sp. SH-PL62]AMV38820.1 hypothetical protein VT85_15400 [Planctomyces sp. SH-PL62]
MNRLYATCLVLMLGPAVLAGQPAEEDDTLAAVFDAHLKESFRREPLSATRLGEHAYDDRLDDVSPEARRSNLEFLRETLRKLSSEVRPDKLSDAGKVDYDVFRRHLEGAIWSRETFDPFRDDPRIYGDYVAESVYLLLTQSSLPREVNRRNALKRMDQIPRVLETARVTIGPSPRVKVETAIRQTEGAVAFYKTDVFRLAGDEPGEGGFAGPAAKVVDALGGHLAFLKDEVLPRSHEDWRIGRDKFVKKLDYELDAGLSADEILAEAEREASRVESEMAVLARQLWAVSFPGEVVPPDDDAGRRAMIRRVLARIGDDHGTAETLVADARSTVQEIRKFITERKILALPEPDQLRIIEMPEFLRGNSVAYLNPAPPLDARGSSEYAISPPPSDWSPARAESFLHEYNRAMLKILTVHEAYPGHYVQLEYSNRCPSLIRRVLSSGTFAEGWAVYTEQMMLDQGFGAGDLVLRLQQLKFYLRAVVNAILDSEMHRGGMTDDQARELLVGRAFQTEGEAEGKIIRSKQSSCQLSTYFVGRTAFTRLRRSIQREQGERFDLAAYHEAVLSEGTLPVKHLPQLVRTRLGLAPEEIR